MGFFKNKSVVFKLILALCIVFVMNNFIINGYVVQALDEKHAKAEHEDKMKDLKEGEDYTVETKKEAGKDVRVFTFISDGCIWKQYIGEGTTTGGQVRETWTSKDGTVYYDTGVEYANSNQTDNSNEEQGNSIAAQGGQLLQPVVDLLLTLGDGIMDVIQRAVVGTDGHIHIDIGISILGMIIGIIFAVIAIAAVIIAFSSLGAWVTGLVSGIGWLANGIAATKGIATVVVAVGALGTGLSMYSHTVSAFNASFLPDITVFPTYSVSPEEIFEGKLLIFDVNFFKPKDLYVKLDNDDAVKIQEFDETTDTREVKYYFYYDNNHKEVPTSKQNTAMELSSVIAKWYYTIRNIALVIMMLVLVYVGIRMMLCSIASEKSKYKKMLGDWLISMCLVFVLHYIMVFAVNINESIVDLMEVATDQNQQSFELDLQDMGKRKEKFIEAVKEDPKLLECLYLPGDVKATEDNADQATLFMWPVNLVGRVRMMAQMQNGSSEYVGYAIAFLVLVFYTVFFAFTYLKRVLYLAFLTVIAPLVAMTYPIDKISDGKAQAFNMWLKEYIFNLLIQPVHLLLYMLLISMAIDLASQNIIYTLVAIGFMMPAEKLIRSMFGFEKAKTPGFLGGAAGAAVAMGAMTKLAKMGSGSKSKNKPAGKLDKSGDDSSDDMDSGIGAHKGFDGINLNDSSQEADDDKPQIEDGGNNLDGSSRSESGNDQGDNSQNDSVVPINFDTYEPEQYFDDPEEYNEWLDLATLPDGLRTEDGEARQKELEEKAQKTKNSRLGRTDSSVRRCKRESKSRTITECTKTSKVTKSWRFR